MAYKISYVADGTGLNFLNGVTALEAGQVLTVGAMQLVTKVPIAANTPGFAHFIGGPRPVWELWQDVALVADVTLMDVVSLPAGGAAVGFAVPHPNDNVILDTAAVVAKIGWFVTRFVARITP